MKLLSTLAILAVIAGVSQAYGFGDDYDEVGYDNDYDEGGFGDDYEEAEEALEEGLDLADAPPTLAKLNADVARLYSMIYTMDEVGFDALDEDDDDDDDSDDDDDDTFYLRRLTPDANVERKLGGCTKKKKKCKKKCDKKYKNSRCNRKLGYPKSWCWSKKWACKSNCNNKC